MKIKKTCNLPLSVPPLLLLAPPEVPGGEFLNLSLLAGLALLS